MAGGCATKLSAPPPNARLLINEAFRKLARVVSNLTGSALAFLLAAAVVIAWGTTGPLFHFSDTWQLVINTATTIVTFLMVFLIQNTQNRDSQAIHTKLDELLVATQGARNSLAIAEELSDEELHEEREHFEEVAKAAGEAKEKQAGRATPTSENRARARKTKPTPSGSRRAAR